MSCKYIKAYKGYRALNRVIEVEIFDSVSDLHLKEIPFKPTYDVPYRSSHSKTSRSLVSVFMRQVGGYFEGMSSDQRKQMRRFIMMSGL
jgi:hypothetical protein